MPLVSIEVTNGFTKGKEVALMRAVYSSLKKRFISQ